MNGWRPEPDLERLVESRHLKSLTTEKRPTGICGGRKLMSNLFGAGIARLNGEAAHVI